MKNIISYFILLILFNSCSEKIEYKELAAEKAKQEQVEELTNAFKVLDKKD